MTKLALRVTRKWSKLRGRGNRAPRPKTFASEEKAHAWAKAQGFEKYTLENLRNEESSKKKIRVVVEV